MYACRHFVYVCTYGHDYPGPSSWHLPACSPAMAACQDKQAQWGAFFLCREKYRGTGQHGLYAARKRRKNAAGRHKTLALRKAEKLGRRLACGDPACCCPPSRPPSTTRHSKQSRRCLMLIDACLVIHRIHTADRNATSHTQD